MLRTLVRDKANLVAECGDWLRRMQKSLDRMNVRVHRASPINMDGVTGIAILRAIAEGERDGRKLAKLRDTLETVHWDLCWFWATSTFGVEIGGCLLPPAGAGG